MYLIGKTSLNLHLPPISQLNLKCSLSFLQEFREKYPRTADLISDVILGEQISAEIASTGEEYKITGRDERHQIFRQIRERRGQREFRDALRKRYYNKCMLSGCETLHVIEAAHIQPYRGPQDNHVENGLLLRADIHTLFDLDLIGIDPSSHKISLHPDIKSEEYRKLEGCFLQCPNGAGPSKQALETRWNIFKVRLKQPCN